jgi:hypothetical protein
MFEFTLYFFYFMMGRPIEEGICYGFSPPIATCVLMAARETSHMPDELNVFGGNI